MSDNNCFDKLFEKKVRIRVCGILVKDSKVLLLKHMGIGSSGYIWAPPGGGVNFGESIEDCLRREFEEETNIKIRIEKFLFINEYRDDRFHAIEIFFKVASLSGELKLGLDPELNENNQILVDAQYFSNDQISNIPKEKLHNLFRNTEDMTRITDLYGLISFNI